MGATAMLTMLLVMTTGQKALLFFAAGPIALLLVVGVDVIRARRRRKVRRTFMERVSHHGHTVFQTPAGREATLLEKRPGEGGGRS